MKLKYLILLIHYIFINPTFNSEKMDTIYAQEIKEDAFKSSINGEQTELFTLKNKNGVVVQITNYGGKIVNIFVPDRKGKMSDIVLGYESIDDYVKGNPYFGAVCGRYANRIAKGKFTIGENEYQLPINNGPNHLHGGPEGFNNKVFKVISYSSASRILHLSCFSKDGEMGYPGNLVLNVKYTLTDDNELRIDFEAVTDKATYVNICFHSFFNLAGEGNGDILDHELMINANSFTPISNDLIPTGELTPVQGTPMDFTKPTTIGLRIDTKYDQLEYGCGYDHNWVLNKKPGELALAAKCREPKSGRVLEVYTTQPGMQLYTGNWLDGSDKGKGGKEYHKRSALCLETQNFPDSPNHGNFPSTLLKPGEIYKHICLYKFSVE